MLSWIAFVVLGLVLLFAARKVVVSQDLVHSVLWLAVTLVATAGLYVTLHAEFLAAVQVMLYTGGVITLMLFGIMLTRRMSAIRIEHGSQRRLRGAVIALAGFVLVGLAVTRAGDRGAGTGMGTPDGMPFNTAELGRLFLTDLMLPFEVLSILLLAAMIGAIVLARKTDP